MADSSATTGSAVTATATATTVQAAVPTAAPQQKLSESDDFTDNSAENTKEANQEDTSQQSGLATVESEYDTASDSPSDGEEGQVVEESGVDGEEEDDEDDEEDGTDGTEGTEEGSDDDDEGSDDGDDDVVEVLDYERQSGDGQEQDVESRRKVDDDEDRSNPQYIPKKGTFYEHDDRTAETDPDDRGGMDGDDQPGGRSKRDDELDDGGGGGGGGDHHGGGGSGSGSGGGPAGATGGGGAGSYSVGERRGSEKGGAGALKGRKKWQASTDRWTHDRFDESEQAPKSRAELVSAYGYDIRSEDGPPKARRKRRYARGPNQYTRNWEDEDAYQKSSNVEHQRHKKVPRPEEFPELGPKSSAGARGPAGAGRTRVTGQKNAPPRQAAGELGVGGRTGRPGVRGERVRSGDWAADRDRDQVDHEYGAPVEYGSGGEGLRYRNEDQRPNARNTYHNNKENKQGAVRNGGKEKDGYGKVINSLQFKNQTRINPRPDGGGAAQGPGAASGGDGPARGGPPVLHSNSAGALSGSSNSNKMNNSGPTPPTGNSSNTSLDRVEPQASFANVSTSASLGSVPSSGAQHYGHVPSIVQMQQPPLQHQQQQPVQQSSQSSHSQALKSQGYHEDDHPKYGAAMYGGPGLDHEAGPVRMQSKDRQLLASVSAGANVVVPLASAPSGGHNQRSQVSPRAIVAQTSPTVPQQQSQPITMQMQYQQQPPGVAYGVTPQGPIPTHSLQQLQHQQQQQQQQQLLTSEPVVNRSKRYSSQRQRSQLENMNLAMQQSSLHDHQQAQQQQQQQQLLQHQQMLQHQHQQEQMQQNKLKQSYQQPPQQQQQQQPQPIPPQALPQSAAGGGAGGLPMTLQQTGDYHLQQAAVAAKSQPQPPPQPAGPPPPPQYHQAPAVYYTSAAPTNVPPGPGDYVTTGPPVPGPPPPQVQPPPPQPQPQYVPPPYATQGPPSQGGYLAGPPVAPPASAYLPPPPQASPTVVGPPQAPPGGPVPNYVPALGPPPPAAPVNPGPYPATAYAGFQPGYNPAVVPQGVVTGAPPPPVVAPGATGPPPPAALYQPAGGITYYAPQTQAQAPRPLPTGRRPTAAIPILAPPDRKPVPAPGNAQLSKAPNAASVGSREGDGGGIEGTAPGVGEADSGENIDHILDNMFVQRPPYQPPSRKSPSPALQPSVAVAAPVPGSGPSMMGTEGNANGATELVRHGSPEADKKVMDGGGGGTTQELVDTIGDSVKKLSLQDEKLSHGASLADGNNETNTSAVAGVVSDVVADD
ncbi:ataxin-2 homolog [Anopheles cruzii]|uniref:ataxin-2 homolog n=1 Tax=Anopheles cruzii TaxID=68878 RepID=UPI0022EC208C|nr:ataxin-2 homolog [Anopheles cruzii]